jgi:hypothetical protein
MTIGSHCVSTDFKTSFGKVFFVPSVQGLPITNYCDLSSDSSRKGLLLGAYIAEGPLSCYVRITLRVQGFAEDHLNLKDYLSNIWLWRLTSVF